MKTTFKAKIIFETDQYQGYHQDNKDERPIFTLRELEKIINSQEVQVECINDYWTNQGEPTIVIKQLTK